MRPIATLVLSLALLAAAASALAAPGGECRKNPDCSDGDPCTVDRCDRRTKTCRYTPATNGTTCNDGDACTRTDTCQAGTCTGANPVVCSAPDVCQVAGTCDPATGTCTNPPAPDGTACNDLDYCTQTDVCQDGACVGTQPVVCTPIDACHLAGSCDPATGVCSNPPVNPLVCNEVTQCNSAGACDPGTGACTTPEKANGTPCTDGDACTQSDACAAGACVGSDPVVCDAPGVCQSAATCDPWTGACTGTPLPDGTPCETGSGLVCGEADQCQAGACTAGGGGDTDGDGICDASDGCATMPDTSQADLDADGAGDVCDDADAPLTLTRAAVRIGRLSRAGNGTILLHGVFTPATGTFDLSQGLAVRVGDGVALAVSHAWTPAECRSARSGRRTLCRTAGDPSTRAKLRAGLGGEIRFVVRLGRQPLAAPFGAPVTLAVTTAGAIDHVGTLADCRLLAAGLACGS